MARPTRTQVVNAIAEHGSRIKACKALGITSHIMYEVLGTPDWDIYDSIRRCKMLQMLISKRMGVTQWQG